MDRHTLPQISMHVVQAGPVRSGQEYAPGTTIRGLREYQTFRFELPGCAPVRVFVDDVELHPDQSGCYAWRPDFIAGRVELVVQKNADEFIFHAIVEASRSKLEDGVFERMVEEILGFRAALLVAACGATRQFGEDVREAGLPMLVRMLRMVTYAPSFLRQLDALCSAPHRKLLPVQRTIALSRAKRIPASAMRMPSVAALARGDLHGDLAIDRVHVAASLPSPTFDTPANRALKALLVKISAHASHLLIAMKSLRDEAGQSPQYQRRPRREAQLQAILHHAAVLLRKEPFASIARTETSAAGLMQIAAQPAYTSACRLGMKALWSGFGGTAQGDHLPIQPTWGVYEAWCLVHLMTRLQEHFGNASWQALERGCATADESYCLEVGGGITIEIYYQPIFWARSANEGKLRAWSISRRRIPDIVLAIRRHGSVDFVVLDAKFRQGRANVLEAMESAHLYHDALRIGDKHPDWCLLLLPASTKVAHLDAPGFVAEHGVGTISEFCPQGKGVDVCVARVVDWIASPVTRLSVGPGGMPGHG